MMKHIAFPLIAALALFATAGCKKEKGFEHDPNAPVVIEKFTPEVGGAGVEVLIYGSNFTKDTSGVSVTVNGVPAFVAGVVEDRILIAIPPKAGTGKIEVNIRGHKGSSTDDFGYKPSTVVTTFAGSGNSSYVDGKGTAASFNIGNRCGIDIDENGNLYVPEAGNLRVRKIAPDGTVTTLTGNGNSGYKEGAASEAEFYMPFDVVAAGNGIVYVSDPAAWTIRKVTANGTTSLVGWFEAWGMGIDRRNGTLYYTDARGDGSVYKVDPATGASEKIIGSLSYPSDVAVDSKGNLYVVVNGSHIIRQYKAGSWEPGVTIGIPGQAGLVNGPAASAKFDLPWSVAVDANDNLFIAGNGTWDGSSTNTNQCIRFVNTTSWEVSTFTGGSTAGFADGTGSAALFSAPTGVTVGADGAVYVVDRKNDRIRKVIAE
ncbi:IPT/TIG domain-containing protein [Chitinophaga caseinilytica]|uniref:IPT/TIG domain-containing protein n=1 Tax=Chitinophaga caseinilytica TaxID=2267521 RepID=A0ABZ2Z3R4_9BACT